MTINLKYKGYYYKCYFVKLGLRSKCGLHTVSYVEVAKETLSSPFFILSVNKLPSFLSCSTLSSRLRSGKLSNKSVAWVAALSIASEKKKKLVNEN
jgi:hypothetical protein